MLSEASTQCPKSRRLFITDRSTETQYLIGTAADLCVFPRALLRGRRESCSYELYEANNTVISIYGSENFTLDLEFRRNHSWRFVIADVSKPIIGVDFLDHYALLINIRNRRLVDN